MPIHSEAMLRNHRFDLTAVTDAKSKQSELHYKKKTNMSILQLLCVNTLRGHNLTITSHYLVIDMGKDVKVTRACLNSGRIEKISVEALRLNNRPGSQSWKYLLTYFY